jgi:hypothetical protein
LLTLAFVVLTTLVSLAQESANQDNTKQAATQEKQEHKPTSHLKTVTGCLQKGDETGEFSITGEDGKTWELSSESVKLDDHVARFFCPTEVRAAEQVAGSSRG